MTQYKLKFYLILSILLETYDTTTIIHETDIESGDMRDLVVTIIRDGVTQYSDFVKQADEVHYILPAFDYDAKYQDNYGYTSDL